MIIASFFRHRFSGQDSGEDERGGRGGDGLVGGVGLGGGGVLIGDGGGGGRDDVILGDGGSEKIFLAFKEEEAEARSSR